MAVCTLLWLGVKKENKPAKAVERKKVETKVVPAKRQHAAKKDAAPLVSCLQHLCTQESMHLTCGKSCCDILLCCVRREKVVRRRSGRRMRRRPRYGSGGRRNAFQTVSSGDHWSIVYVRGWREGGEERGG